MSVRDGRLRSSFFFRILVAGASLAALALAGPGAAVAAPVVFSDAGATPADILDTVNAFRGAVGAPNNANAPGPLPGGRREINWDGGGGAALVNTNLAKTAFLNNRGAFFGPAATIFSISGAPSPEFGNINPTYPDIFQTFSSPRLFSPTNSIVTEETFFVPGFGLTKPASVSGFGAVFTDVDLADTTRIEFFDIFGDLIGSHSVPVADGGLSFLGVFFPTEPRVGRVRITTGNTVLGPDDNPAGGIDVVVMDDFISSEPQLIPAPAALALVGLGLTVLGLRRRSTYRRNCALDGGTGHASSKPSGAGCRR